MTPAREWLEEKLGDAVLRACLGDDRRLVARGVGERSLMFRVGHYLAPAVEEQRSRPRLWVDLEFNREITATGERTAKRVAELQRRLDALGDPGKPRLVVPDLIVHDRRDDPRGERNGPSDHNILVVEAKKASAGSAGEAFDRWKLDAYQRDFGYRYAVFLKLGARPEWQWAGFDDGVRFACTSDQDMEPVRIGDL